MNLEVSFIQATTGATEANARYWKPYLEKTMSKYGITTPVRMLVFLSEIGWESGHLSDITENGNSSPYKGRGLIQVTGFGNYKAAGQALGQDFVNHPELLEKPEWAAMASGWWWQVNNMNFYADKIDIKKSLTDPTNASIYADITRRINAGPNGVLVPDAHNEQRMNIFQAGWTYLQEAGKKIYSAGEKTVQTVKEHKAAAFILVTASLLIITSVIIFRMNKAGGKLA
ncbi:MAG TPA: hypothetical protein DCQ93_01530 [Bacteroidetes bacterium]|nr:hypothetical protein [Bacteroidota bacterium]